ncbi:MAG: latrotoxin-related protein [Wolbachia endosymbiont of Homalodisca vitripennis]|nr:latrotoxin-related protein [Wolbachia endosymbiont of Homalodisca vitripennis]
MSGEKRIKILEQKIDELQQEAEETSKDLEKFYKTDIGISWNRHFKKFRDKFTHWDPRNCAEPHVITSLSRSSQIFPSLSSDYNLEDIRYLATYKLTHNDGLPQLTEFPRCDHCVITTRPIRNIITDPYWLDKIFDLEKKLPGLGRKQDLYKQRLYFLTPYYDMLNRLIKTNVTNDREGSISARGRRSAFDELAEIEIISNEGNNIGSKISTVSSVINQRNDHYATNVSEGATNSAAKSSSIINNLFSWVKSSIGGLLSSKSVGVSSTKDSISQVDAKMDVNGTIMLLDLLIRKVTGQKYVSKVDHSISPIEAQGYALNITKGFEKVVEQAGLKSGVSMHRLNIDFVEIQKEVTGKIMSGKFNEISGILKLYIEKACPSREAGCPGKLSSKKFDKFMAEFNSGLNVVLNQSIEHNGDGRLEVDGAKQMSLEPQSYLSNASVQGHSKVSTCLSEIGVTKLGGNLNR